MSKQSILWAIGAAAFQLGTLAYIASFWHN
jgi:hypothetical protein